MNAFLESGFHVFHLGLLRGASVLTPVALRAEWWREWQSELWHVRRECAPAGAASWHAEREMTTFCLGAFQDALCLRRHANQKRQPLPSLHGSAGQCILALAAVLAVSYGISLMIPGVRVESHPEHYRINPGLLLIQNADSRDDSAATITTEQFKRWRARPQRYFDGLAFYRMGAETLITGSRANYKLEVAHSSANLLSLLGLSMQVVGDAAKLDPDVATVILSDETWNRKFGADSEVVGRLVQIGQRTVRVGGVIREGAWRLPGKPDAWLLEPEGNLFGVGYVVAHLTPLGQTETSAQWVPITAYNSYDTDENLCGLSFEERTQGPWQIYLFTVMLAFLSLPAITSVSMGEYSFNSHRLTLVRKLLRWAFLSAKIGLLLPIVYYVSLDLSYWQSTFYSTASVYAQLITSFVICLFGLRWVLLDQRQRCPVCLRKVTHPVQVGLASRTFLAWNGTELMCMGGHSLLHVPSLPTSWFSAQRWLYLDTSWEFLFAGQHLDPMC